MTPSDFENELYREFDWRLNEINLLKNSIKFAPDLFSEETLRKSAIVVLYSHFEGFCVFALQHYVTALNAENLAVRLTSSAIVAGAWENVFRAMETGDQKCDIFRATLPNDPKLHRHWRRRHFVEEIDRLRELPVHIPDSTVDAESNLKSKVLKRNLFLLGLDHSFIDDTLSDVIDNLLGRRNRIAHGEDKRGVSENEFKVYESIVFSTCMQIIEFLVDSFSQKKFLNYLQTNFSSDIDRNDYS